MFFFIVFFPQCKSSGSFIFTNINFFFLIFLFVYLRAALCVDEDVVRFDIPVDDFRIARVQVQNTCTRHPSRQFIDIHLFFFETLFRGFVLCRTLGYVAGPEEALLPSELLARGEDAREIAPLHELGDRAEIRRRSHCRHELHYVCARVGGSEVDDDLTGTST
jgi:hypothetical protein